MRWDGKKQTLLAISYQPKVKDGVKLHWTFLLELNGKKADIVRSQNVFRVVRRPPLWVFAVDPRVL